MEHSFERKKINQQALLMGMLKEVIGENTPKSLRLAFMAILHGSLLARNGYDESVAIEQLMNSGVDMDVAMKLLPVAQQLLVSGGILSYDYEIDSAVIDYLMPRLPSQLVMRPAKSAYIWTSPVYADLKMLRTASDRQMQAMEQANMPEVYSSLNAMQAVGYRRNKVIERIPDWKNAVSKSELLHLQNNNQIMSGRMYFMATFDFRGRMYYRGAVNPSNTGDFAKGYFKFAESTVVGKDGLKAMRLYIAGLAGIKGSISTRVQWTQENAVALWNSVEGKQIAEIQRLTGEKKIFQLYAALQDYVRVMRMGGAIAKSALPIRQDGSCNGIQHSSAILRNEQAARAVNIGAATDDDLPNDIYRDYADALIKVLPAKWHSVLNRSIAKKPVMVAGYGAGDNTVLFGEDGISDSLIAAGRDDLAEELASSEDLQELFIDTLKLVIKPVVQLIDLVKSKMELRDYAPVTWLTLDRFPVRQTNRILKDRCYDVLVLSERQSLKLRNSEPAVLDEKRSVAKQASSLTVNLIHSLDATHMRLVAARAGAEDISFVHTHDDFGCHASDFYRLNTFIREEFVRLHSQDVFASINRRNGLDIVPPTGTYDLDEALSATYMFS